MSYANNRYENDYVNDKVISPVDAYDSGYNKSIVVDGYDKSNEVYPNGVVEPYSPDVDQTMRHHLKKTLRWYDLMSLGIGCIIGAGIFVTTGSVFSTITGPAIVVSYVVAGTCCAFASLCYSEFAAMAPNSGSAYAFTSQTLGEIPAWLVGWNLVLEYTVSAATVTQGFSSYFQTFVSLCGGNIFPRSPATNPNASGVGSMWISYTFWDFLSDGSNAGGSAYLTGSAIDLWAMLLALCLGLLVTWGISESTRFNNTMVVIKLAIVLFVIALGGYWSSSANFTPFAPYGYGGLQFFGNKAFGQSNANGAPIGMLAGASTVFFAYIGFDAVTAQSEEARNPARDLPIGIIGSLVVATGLYIGVVVVLSGMIPFEWINPNSAEVAATGNTGLANRGISNGSILADIFTYHGQHWAAFIVTIGAICGLTSVTLVTMMGQPRIFMSMARDGLLPSKFFAEIHPYTRTPWRSCLLLCACTTILAGTMPQNVLLSMTNIGTLFAFTFVCISLPVYRYMNPDRPRPFRAPLSDWRFPLVPVLGAGLSIILAFSLDSQNWYRLLGWVGVGLIIYIGFGRRNARKTREEKASLPISQQFYQGPDDTQNNEHGITTDQYSDPALGVHKDALNDSAYIPEHGYASTPTSRYNYAAGIPAPNTTSSAEYV